MRAASSDLRFRFSRTFTVTQRRWSAFLDRRLRDLGLSTTQWHALVEVSRTDAPLSQNELATLVGIENTSLVKLLDKLEKQGFIRRIADAKDRRVKRIELLPRADGVLDEISEVAADVRRDLLSGVSDEDIRVCLRVLDQIAAELDRTN